MDELQTINNPDKHVSKNRNAQASAVSRDQRTAAQIAAHDASLLKLKAAQLAKMQAVDVQELLLGIAGGMTQTEAARRHGVDPSTLSVWINSQSGQLGKDIAQARKCAADALADRALSELEAVRGTESAVDVALARELSKHFSWRSGLADRARWHDKGELQTVQSGQAVQPPAFTIKIISGNNTGQTTVDITPDQPALDDLI